MKFHMNPETGGITRCRAASIDSCPFSGDTKDANHFDTIAEAKDNYEKVMSDKTITTHSKPRKTSSNKPRVRKTDVTPYLADNPELARANQAFLDQEADWQQREKNVKNRRISDDGFRNSPEEYQEVQARKNSYYKMMRLKQELDSVLPKSVLNARRWVEKKKVEAKEKRFEEWKEKKNKENGPFNFHPDITPKNEHQARAILSSWSGLSGDEIDLKVADAGVEGFSKTEAYRKVFAELPLRTDKSLVSIDLEVAAPMKDGKVDTGSYSSIIEVGYVTRYPDGRVVEGQKLSGVPEDLLVVEGTGAQHIHNISPEMVEGLTPFSEDTDLQARLLNHLDGKVLIAHNAVYETNQFRANLPGFSKALEEGRVEVLDTRMVSQFFAPQTETNSNQGFVEGTGGEYRGAHRAKEDAVMTINALFRLKGMDEPAPPVVPPESKEVPED